MSGQDHGQHSLAHELAVALMPEPSAGSRLLAEEFGIEYDEGAEGIDQSDVPSSAHDEGSSTSGFDAHSFGQPDSNLDDHSLGASFGEPQVHDDLQSDEDPMFAEVPRRKSVRVTEVDAMEILAQDLEYTDKFLSHLRHIDSDPSSPPHQQQRLGLEKMAQDVIRRLDESTRDREGQVRELLGYEREFRKIAGEIGGSDALAELEEFDPMPMEESGHTKSHFDPEPTTPGGRRSLEEPSHDTQDWEVDPDRLGEDNDDDPYSSVAPTPVRDTFPAPPPIHGPTTPAVSITHMAHFRTFTTSLVSSLSTISEQAQVNGAATTEAGRKIRALKNKMGGWRTEWDSAERSREKIEKWEAGLSDTTDAGGPARVARRVDGRALVQEHLQAFERALADAATKTQAIMATS